MGRGGAEGTEGLSLEPLLQSFPQPLLQTDAQPREDALCLTFI